MGFRSKHKKPIKIREHEPHHEQNDTFRIEQKAKLRLKLLNKIKTHKYLQQQNTAKTKQNSQEELV